MSLLILHSSIKKKRRRSSEPRVMQPCALLLPALPASCLVVIGVHSFAWESIITIATHRVSARWRWWHWGMRGLRAGSGCADEEERPCLLLEVTSWQSTTVEEGEQGEGNGSGAHGWIAEEAAGKRGEFLPPARTGVKKPKFRLCGAEDLLGQFWSWLWL